MTKSIEEERAVEILRFGPDEQAKGAFDGGRITETKPVGFPGEGSVPRVGPLFYWAWATSHAPAVIGMHPHRGFEIMSYVLEGEMVHRDTLGTVSIVGRGGAQVMQTGSGVSHQEEVGAGGEFFQIWFEPDLKKAMTRPATYREFHRNDFLREELENGASITRLIGEAAPILLEVPVAMVDVEIASEGVFSQPLDPGEALALVVVAGQGTVVGGSASQAAGVRDFVIVRSHEASLLGLQAGPKGMRVVAIRVPQTVDYPLYAA